MAKREFSDALTTFVNKYITSVEQIEVLLLLLANPQRVWSVEEISAILRSSVPSIQTRLTSLVKARLAVGAAEVGYRYAATGRLHALVEELSDQYGARRFSVIELVFSRPDPARSFADAFRLRDEEQ